MRAQLCRTATGLSREVLAHGHQATPTLSELRASGVVALTKTQMAAALQISVRSLKGMMHRGEIAYFKIGTDLVRFPVEEAMKRMSETVLVSAPQVRGQGCASGNRQ
jgi:hypothetical protein